MMNWLLTNGVRIAAVIAGAWILLIALRAALRGVFLRVIAKRGARLSDDDRKRAATIARVVNRTVTVAVIAVVLMMVLSEFGLNIGPLIAGAGIVGVAVGFGAQTLVKDGLSGLFILMENQYRVGDVIRIDTITGEVEDITLRRTVLRDEDGAIHQITNGDIRRTTNYSRESARVSVSLPIAHGADAGPIIALANRVGAELAEDSAFKKMIKRAPAFDRIDTITGSGYAVIVSAGAAPHEQWRVQDELRKRLLEALQKEGVKLG
jgi:moderate conductance mechanosensitive channel